MEDRTIVLQELFTYEPKVDSRGKYAGVIQPTGLRPRFIEKLKQHGVELPAAVFRKSGAATRATTTKGGTR